MTIYEQIQKAINYIEKNIANEIRCEEVAYEAHLSLRSFYNYFWSITGFSYKQYVIKRRLSRSLKLLRNSNKQVVEVAFESGYETHESFSRAFKKEFRVSPVDFQKQPDMYIHLQIISKIKIIKEMYMGVVIKKLETMDVLTFDGFAPKPEEKAFHKMNEYLKQNKLEDIPHRIFGHNIDLQGNIAHDPDNVGYRVLVHLNNQGQCADNSVTKSSIDAGRFVVTGIEGNFENDQSGKWITAGWQKLQEMIKTKGYKVKCQPRYFEEQLEPSQPGNLRLDLYLEIE